MRVKPIVKVMNFHALIRVDKARRKADKYMQLEKEASDIIDVIANNRNFQLDKSLWQTDATKPQLNIYFGSDLGFCGSINFAMNQFLEKDTENDKILIGRKLRQSSANVKLSLAREEFAARYEEIYAILEDTIRNKSHSEINLVYNHFYNTTRIEPVKKRVFPFTIEHEGGAYTDDFYVEGNANRILADLITTYVNYEVKIAEGNSFASENIFRQNSTSESLKKIEELEAEEFMLERKERTQKEFGKVIDNYTKTKGKAGSGK
ncbi:MAG: F0F1 ATP synthase subunit gamma [Lachnospiraceae bacterium]|nr:F0F1 ATP synthase subunit gamma [Lachnospiraceae bacterium]